ncbi:MAG: type VI secretion system tube protein Hcp [Solirubrobacteraceae bacterium]|nr:type VI secretion system tube protein Hcp [Solirubrobacteraceae bacterium]
MSDKERRLPRSRTARIALPTVAALGAGGAFAAAAIPGADGTVTGCYTTSGGQQGNLRVIDEGQSCNKAETQITWNQKGVQGDRGPEGPAGPQGQTGPQGPAGASEALLIGGEALQGGRAQGFLTINGIKGESTDKAHKDAIDISSFSFGVTNSGSAQVGGGLGAGKASFSSFKFNKLYDSSSPALFEGTATGEHFKDATFVFRRNGENPVEFLTVKLTDVLISGYQQGGTKEPPLHEAVSLDAAKISIEYKPQKADGSLGPPITAGYDLKENKTG